MDIEALKQTIQQRAGVPASLLTGETAEETIAQAKALLAYKRENEGQHETTAQRFGAWASAQLGVAPKPDMAAAALADIEEGVRIAAGGYPQTRDGGEIDGDKLSDPRPTREQFAEWMGQHTAIKLDGWI